MPEDAPEVEPVVAPLGLAAGAPWHRILGKRKARNAMDDDEYELECERIEASKRRRVMPRAGEPGPGVVRACPL